MPISYFRFAVACSWLLSLVFASGLNNGLSRNEASLSIHLPRIINALLFLFPYKRRISIVLLIIQSCNLVAIIALAILDIIFKINSLSSFFLYFISAYSVIGFGSIIWDISQNDN